MGRHSALTEDTLRLRELARTRTPIRISRRRAALARVGAWLDGVTRSDVTRTMNALAVDVALLMIPLVATVVLVGSWAALVSHNTIGNGA
jgi:hypothetical protein